MIKAGTRVTLNDIECLLFCSIMQIILCVLCDVYAFRNALYMLLGNALHMLFKERPSLASFGKKYSRDPHKERTEAKPFFEGDDGLRDLKLIRFGESERNKTVGYTKHIAVRFVRKRG